MKPGWLTQQFLLGRRASFTPPFRMYLILSVVFFLIASLDDPGSDLDIRNDDERSGFSMGGKNPLDEQAPAASQGKPPAADGGAGTGVAVEPDDAASKRPGTSSSPGTTTAAAAKPLDAGSQRAIDEIVKRVPADERAQWRADLERELSTMPAGDREKLAQVVSDPCGKDNLKFDLGGSSGPYEARLRLACTKIMADKATFGRALWDNIPKMMFIFLPLIAGVMSVLYLGSRRYYVEHLVFFVHYHAFFFLTGILLLICEQLGNPEGNAIARAFDTIANLLEFVCLFYVPWYLYRAMRRVYGQGRLWTLAKFFVLNVAYIVCILLTGIGLLFYTALSL